MYEYVYVYVYVYMYIYLYTYMHMYVYVRRLQEIRYALSAAPALIDAKNRPNTTRTASSTQNCCGTQDRTDLEVHGTYYLTIAALRRQLQAGQLYSGGAFWKRIAAVFGLAMAMTCK